MPSSDAFVEHAIASAAAWPQLDEMELLAATVIEGTDLSRDSTTWLVPLLSDGRMVAVSRFVPAGEAAKLGEVALLEQPLDPLPEELPGELVLFVDVACADDPSIDCLFSELRWAVRLADGAFELPDGSIVEELPVRAGSPPTPVDHVWGRLRLPSKGWRPRRRPR